jgi:heme exporter protein C
MKTYLKITAVAAMFWVIPMAFLGEVSVQPILHETIRNLYWHVTMWFSMFILLLASVVHGIAYLRHNNPIRDEKSLALTQVALLYGCIGIVTGMIWARFTWGTWWTFAEPKMNLSALTLLLFVSYFILRSAVDDPRKRAKLAAVYNVFAVTTVPFLLYVIPRQLPSLHPGADGNPAFSEVTAPELRLIFYPAVIGFIGLAVVLSNLSYRYRILQENRHV